MAALYVLRTLDNKRATAETFISKKEAKEVRDKLIASGTRCVVSRGPDHPHGPTHPDPYCQNTEKTSRKRRRSKVMEALEDTIADLRKAGLS